MATDKIYMKKAEGFFLSVKDFYRCITTMSGRPDIVSEFKTSE